MNYKLLGIGVLMFFIAQLITWFQLNSQFIWKWCKDNECSGYHNHDSYGNVSDTQCGSTWNKPR